MIVVYGKWKVWKWLESLLNHLLIDHVLMDDADYNDDILSSVEYVIVSPGIKPSHVVYQKYHQKILSELNYLWLILPTLGLPSITYIGITWTNGKSTTSSIMYQALQKLLPSSQIWLTWNFDTPLSETILSILKSKEDKEHICVVETSSFMLYNLENFIFDYAIWLNIARDHLDRHGDMDQYIAAKMSICKNSRHCFISKTLYGLLPLDTQQIATIIPDVIDISYTKFLWKHNMYNISAVICCLQSICEKKSIDLHVKQIFSSIDPLPHRIQTIATIDGVRIVDDGISTSAQSLLVWLEAMDSKCVLIAGWYDKGDDYSILASVFAWNVWCVVWLGKNKHIFADIAHDVWVPYVPTDTLKDAVDTAISKAKELNLSLVLYSPGAASFDMFKNVYDRVEQFNQIVSWLTS